MHNEEKCATCWSFSHMCITMHDSENIKSVFNFAVYLMAVCVVKQDVYSTELLKLYHGDVPGMVMVTVL